MPAKFFTVQCTLVQSTILQSRVVCMSICLSVTLVDCDHALRLEILETNCTYHQSNHFALWSPRTIHLVPEEHCEIFGRLGGVGKSGMLEHKSGNISETCKDRAKVTMEGFLEITNDLLNGTIPKGYGLSSQDWDLQPPPKTPI